MHRRDFLVRVLAVVLGVNTLAWSVSVGLGGQTVPITSQGISAQSISANVVSAIAATTSTSSMDTAPSHFSSQ